MRLPACRLAGLGPCVFWLTGMWPNGWRLGFITPRPMPVIDREGRCRCAGSRAGSGASMPKTSKTTTAPHPRTSSGRVQWRACRSQSYRGPVVVVGSESRPGRVPL